MIGKEIKYKIDNFSGILDVSWDNLPSNKEIGVYFLYDENKQLLYIGKSVSSIRARLNHHLFRENPDGYNEGQTKVVIEKRKQIKYFSYTIIPKNYIDMVERYLITEHQCEFNLEFKYDMDK